MQPGSWWHESTMSQGLCIDQGSIRASVQLLSGALSNKNAKTTEVWVISTPCFVTRIHV